MFAALCTVFISVTACGGGGDEAVVPGGVGATPLAIAFVQPDAEVSSYLPKEQPQAVDPSTADAAPGEASPAVQDGDSNATTAAPPPADNLPMGRDPGLPATAIGAEAEAPEAIENSSVIHAAYSSIVSAATREASPSVHDWGSGTAGLASADNLAMSRDLGLTATTTPTTTATGADPAAPGAIGNFFVSHAFPDIEAQDTPISLAFLNAAPAGSIGRITVSAGHLSVAGKRVRLYGINLPVGAFMPSKEQAPVLAARLAKEGFNAVRIIGFDLALSAKDSFSVTYKQQGVLNADQSLNADAMDKLDFFVHQLQRAGIYVTFPLHSARKYRQALDCIDACEGVDNYMPQLIQEQKDFATSFLNHFNPHSGVSYKDDPGVFAIEINNENSLTHRWANGTIDKYFANATLAAKYGDPLKLLWQAWVKQKYFSTTDLAKAWGQAETSWTAISVPVRATSSTLANVVYSDWIEFMAETESAYKQDIYRHLKQTLGVRALVFDTQSNYNQPFSRDGMDIVDLHSYFGDLGTNTGLTNTPGNGRPVFEVQNRSVLSYADIKDAGMFGIFEGKTYGKPNIITEFAYRDGNQYAAESEPLMAALAGFQDLDAIFLFNYHGMNLYSNRQTYPGWYNMTINAVTRVAAALSFRRGDLDAGEPQLLKKTRKSILNMIAQRKSMTVSNFHFGGDVRAPYTRNMYVQLVDEPAEESIVVGGKAINGAYTSTTGQIVWKPQDRISVNSPRAKTAIGLFRNTKVSLGSGINVTVGNTMNNYAVMSMVSLNDTEVLPSNRMLFTIGGHFTVPGEYPRKPGARRYSWGDDVPRIEAVPATVQITTSANLVVTALDSKGARKFNVPVVRRGGVVEFVTGPAYDTGWYLVEGRTNSN